ncbi:transcriptional regulator [Aquisediminimonas sediminicola]|uniref:transcriptional regulator n=1 Tax=Alteraquisediminimonas sediminicola TaxID=2676787 RepID=UPI001C8F018B|nr:transcriptional regulator [Aquisediminimonas sediminicola]
MINALGEKIRKLRKDHRVTIARLTDLSDNNKSYAWKLDLETIERESMNGLPAYLKKRTKRPTFLVDDNAPLSEEDARDALFFRQYRQMPQATKTKVRQMVRLWSDD